MSDTRLPAASDTHLDLTGVRIPETRVTAETAVEEFRSSLRGELLTPSAAGYEEARRVWNGMIDRRPALIVRCAGTADSSPR